MVMNTTSAKEYVKACEDWYEKHPAILTSEIDALRHMLSASASQRGIEIGTGTGIFSKALGVKHGVEASNLMRKIAASRGIEVTNAVATDLPFPDNYFDYVVLNLCNPFVYSMYFAFSEAYRVLRVDGSLIVCFLEKESPFGKYYLDHKTENLFYYFSNFFSTQKILFELSEAGFRQLNVGQTLFRNIPDTTEPEDLKPGYGKGSFVVVKAVKQKKLRGTSYDILTTLN